MLMRRRLRRKSNTSSSPMLSTGIRCEQVDPYETVWLTWRIQDRHHALGTYGEYMTLCPRSPLIRPQESYSPDDNRKSPCYYTSYLTEPLQASTSDPSFTPLASTINFTKSMSLRNNCQTERHSLGPTKPRWIERRRSRDHMDVLDFDMHCISYNKIIRNRVISPRTLPPYWRGFGSSTDSVNSEDSTADLRSHR
jgi:hypothetical protein